MLHYKCPHSLVDPTTMEPPSPSSSSAHDGYGNSPAPPPINYSLHTRKKAIIISWSIIVVDSCLFPIVMFYALWFSPLSHSNSEPFFHAAH